LSATSCFVYFHFFVFLHDHPWPSSSWHLDPQSSPIKFFFTVHRYAWRRGGLTVANLLILCTLF
jgi:hypothetical protein